MWHKARVNRNKVWLAGHITLAGLPCVGAFPKTVLSTCPEEAVIKVSNAQRRCNEETWLPGWPAKWAPHCLTLPINTTILPLSEKVKRVRFSPL
jgi:hypothetical protein